jgi:rubredoxin
MEIQRVVNRVAGWRASCFFPGRSGPGADAPRNPSSKVAAMQENVTCPKCHGYMYSERFADFALTFFAWKCINCGTVMDTDIIANKNGLHVNRMKLVKTG